ncbi:MAG: HYR domain-containing protein [Acidobacteriota bacterium]|nr:HYR domain-containing protein [Acidobacteriota bacterium]
MTSRNHRPHVTHVCVRALVLISAFMIAVAAVAVPFYSVRSETLRAFSEDNTKRSHPSAAKALPLPGWTSTLNMPVVGETIAIFAADCSTPKSDFNLGEVVCAKTDGVDLTTVPNNYYVNWHGPNGITDGPTITQNPQYFQFALPTGPTDAGLWKANIGRVTPAESSIIGSPPEFTVSDAPSISVFASNCTTPKNVFNLQDTDLTVCAKAYGFPVDSDPDTAEWRVIWSNSDGIAVQDLPASTTNSFTLSANSSLGEWRVILYEPSGGSVYAVSTFTVIDAANPSADISISKGTISSSVEAGSQVVFTVEVHNSGPDAATVEITDAVPNNTTFYEFAPTSAPAGTNCAKPAVGANSGNVVCTIPTLARGETATFLATYDVPSGTAINTVISNTGTVASIVGASPAVPDPNSANNSSTATATVSGSVSETCTLDCPANVTVTADTTEGGQFGAHVTYGAASGTGSCGAVSNSTASGSFFAVGTYSIVSTSELGSASCSFTVTVLDTAPPTITCPADMTVTAAFGADDALVNPGTPTINASGGGTVTGVRSDDTPATYDENGNVLTPAVVHDLYTDPYPIGSTGILWTVTDAGGRKASCSQTITVLEANARPSVTISCQGNVSATAPEGSCEATVATGTPTTNPSDNEVEVTSQRSDGRPLSDPFPGGTTQITWTAYDNITNTSASCVQTVTVTVPGDTTPPTFVDTAETPFPPNLNVTTSSCTATIEELGEATATDSGACNSGSVTISRSGVPPGHVFPTGTTTIIYTATDGAGNQTTRLQLVTVTESPAVPPTIDAPLSLTAYTGPDSTSCGTVVSDATLGTATASDNCPGVTVTRTGVPAGNFFPVGDTTVTYTATDRSGNTAMGQQVVTVVDNTPPVISCPADITQNTDPGLCSALVDVGTATATDNCDSSPTIVGTRSDNLPLDAPYPEGTTTITWTATDHATPTNNQSSCVQTITVEDNEDPVITTNGLIPSLFPANHAYHTFNVTTFVTGASDNCGGVGISDVVIDKVTSDEVENGAGDGDTFNDIVIAADCKSVQVRAERANNGDGRVYTITFKVTDSHGNVGTATVTIHAPKNLGVPVVDSGPNYTVTGTCP